MNLKQLPLSTETVIPFTCPDIDKLRWEFVQALEKMVLTGRLSETDGRILKDLEQKVFAQHFQARVQLRQEWDNTLRMLKRLDSPPL